MNNLLEINFNDSIVKEIQLVESSVKIKIAHWNGTEVELTFENCMRLLDRQSINQEIGYIELANGSKLMEDLIDDIVDGGGSKQEVSNIKEIIIFDAYDRKMLEVLAESLEIRVTK